MLLPGVLPVKSQCLPFSQIRHTTRLFLDYLSFTPAVQAFYPRSPMFSEWLREEAGQIRYDEARRQKVSSILETQNRQFGSGEKTFANIERLRRGAAAAVTGQQVVLFGGPLFTIFKALTAIRLAEEATAAGVDCVPVFWLATEDHDLAEVNHTSLASESGTPERLAIESRGSDDAPVGTIRLGEEIAPVVDRAVALLGDSRAASWLRESYRPGETMGSAFARLMARLFADWGVILLDQSDPAFHELARPVFRQAAERAEELDTALLAQGKALEAAGYHQQVKVTPASTLLFELQRGARTPVRRKNDSAEGHFMVGESRSTAVELLARIDSNPENFSPNALLRPVVQDYLLPTLVYTGGPAEVAYFAQAAVVYEKLLGRVTPILPRFSATIVEPKAERLLERYQLSLPDLFAGPDKVRQIVAARTLPSDLQDRFAAARTTLEQSMNAVRETLGRLDATLADAASNAEEKMKYQLSQLEARAARAEAQRNEVLTRHADSLNGALYPNKELQEREVAGVSFVARYGPELLTSLHDCIRPDCHDHQVISF